MKKKCEDVSIFLPNIDFDAMSTMWGDHHCINENNTISNPSQMTAFVNIMLKKQQVLLKHKQLEF